MDFRRSEEQEALGALAAEILTDRCTPARLDALEAEGGAVFDRELWRALADAGVLGAVVPEAHGGAGLSIGALLGVLEAVGEAVAPVPLVPTLVLGALSIARYGTPEQQASLLPRVVAGHTVLTAAVEEPLVVTAERSSDRAWQLTGELGAVPYGTEAARLVVAAATGDQRIGLFLVDPSGRGAHVTDLLSTNRQPLASVVLDAAPGELLTTATGAVWEVREHGAAALCVVQAGVCQRALQMTAEHARTRRQFDKAIGEFQAVAQRAADAFIDAEMVRLTAWEALFRLDRGWPASNEVAVAKFWAGEGGMRVVHAAQHLHGGLGVDVAFPLHRYFLWAKQIEHTLGTPTRELVRLGAALADEPV